MIRALCCCLCWCAISIPASAQQTSPADRAAGDAKRLWFTVTTDPGAALTSGAYVGSEIVMDIRFESYDPFKRLRLTLPQIDGARSTTLVRPHTLQINMMGGKGYSHAARLAIVPQQAGTLVIPPISVSGISQATSGRSIEFNETHPEQRITIHPPSPDFAGGTWIVSRQATLEESWTPDITALRTGDTVRRRLVLSVAGVTADDLPELTLASNTGYRVLKSSVAAESEMTETGFVARLEQTWDIYIETDDVFHIDSIQLPYWHPDLMRTEVISAARQRVEPSLRDAAEQKRQLREAALAGHQARRLGLMALLGLPLVGLAVFLALVLRQAMPTRADLTFWRASRSTGSPLAFYGSFLAWGRQAFGPITQVDQESMPALGAPVANQVEHMQQAIFGRRGGNFDAGQTAVRLIWAARRMSLTRFFAAIAPTVSRFLFLR